MYRGFELWLWLVDRAETGSIPQDIAELGYVCTEAVQAHRA